MTEVKFTPGPWTVEVSEESPNGLVIAPGSEAVIAEISSNGQTGTEVMSNARLIAAAPEMLDALRDLRRELRGVVKLDVRKHFSLMVADAAANKAIFKAEGQDQGQS
jgi:hypothetical protein